MSSVAVTPITKATFSGNSAADLRTHVASALGERVSSALLLRERDLPFTVPSGISKLDALTGGLPRGGLTEIFGPVSSGRTGMMLTALAAATQRSEMCALVDANDSFDPVSAERGGVDLDRLFWIRCSGQEKEQRQAKESSEAEQQSGCVAGKSFAFSNVLERVLKVTDLLLQGGGFGMVVLDLGDIPIESVRRIPLASWFRFRRAVELTATVLLLVEREACAKTCASLVLRLQQKALSTSSALASRKEGSKLWPDISGENFVSHANLLRGISFRAEIIHSWQQRKWSQSIGVHFQMHTAL